MGNLSSGKSALVHRYLTGTYVQEESPEGERDGLAWALRLRSASRCLWGGLIPSSPRPSQSSRLFRRKRGVSPLLGPRGLTLLV